MSCNSYVSPNPVKDLSVFTLYSKKVVSCNSVVSGLHQANVATANTFDANTISADNIVSENVTVTGTLTVDGGIIGTGDVIGPASSVNNSLVLFDGTSGKMIKGSNLTLTSNTLQSLANLVLDATSIEIDGPLNAFNNIIGLGTNAISNFDSVQSNDLLSSGPGFIQNFRSIQMSAQGGYGLSNTTAQGGFYVQDSTINDYTDTSPIFVDGNDIEHVIGDVLGPSSSTLNALPRFVDAFGKILKTSDVTLSDTNEFSSSNDISITSTGGDVIITTTAPQSTIITGDLFVTGTTTSTSTTVLNVLDHNIYMNSGYTTPVPLDTSIIFNYEPTSNVALVDTGGFTAGVAAVSNPTVAKTAAHTFSVGDLIQITSASNPLNDGLFEVLSDTSTLLTVRGIGTLGTTVSFVENQFVTDATVAGEIRQVNVYVLTADVNGELTTREGSNTSDSTITSSSHVLIGLTAGASIDVDVSAPFNPTVSLADLPANTIIGNNTIISGPPINLTTAQTTAMLDAFAGSIQGLVPVSPGGTTFFLRADGTWTSPPGLGGTVTSVDTGTGLTGGPVTTTGTISMADMAANTIKGNNTGGLGAPLDLTGGQATALLSIFDASNQGVVGASGGGTTNFLRADGSWSVPDAGVTSVGSGTGLTGGPITTTGTLSLADMAAMTLKGNNTGGATSPIDLTVAQVKTMIGVFATGVEGLVPGGSGVSTNFLRSDGTWVNPPQGTVTSVGTGTGLSGGPVTSSGTISLADMNDQTIKGNNSGGSGPPLDLTIPQLKTMIGEFTAALSGLTPASGGGTTNFLRADMSWTTPPSGTVTSVTAGVGINVGAGPGGTITTTGTLNLATMPAQTIKGNAALVVDDPADLTGGQVTAFLTQFDASNQGVVGASGGGTINFLRADGTWATPAGAGGTVTSVGSGTGLTGGPITGSGTLSLADMAAMTLKGNNTGGATSPIDLTVSQVKTMIGVFATGVEGLVPGGSGVSTNFLRSDGTWVNPPQGTVTSVSTGTGLSGGPVTSSGTISMADMAAMSIKGNNTGGVGSPSDLTATQVTAMLDLATISVKGLLPTLSNNATEFLNGLGSFSTPPQGTVTSVATGTGLTGGPITASGTISLADAADNTIKGNISGGVAAPTDLTGTQVTTILDSFAGTTKGLVPTGSGASTSLFLNGAGAWTSPSTAGNLNLVKYRIFSNRQFNMNNNCKVSYVRPSVNVDDVLSTSKPVVGNTTYQYTAFADGFIKRLSFTLARRDNNIRNGTFNAEVTLNDTDTGVTTSFTQASVDPSTRVSHVDANFPICKGDYIYVTFFHSSSYNASRYLAEVWIEYTL